MRGIPRERELLRAHTPTPRVQRTALGGWRQGPMLARGLHSIAAAAEPRHRVLDTFTTLCPRDRATEGPVLTDQDLQPLHEPLADLERQLIHAHLTSAGHNLAELIARSDEEARRLLAEASRYASAKLSEVEARSHYLHALHGEL